MPARVGEDLHLDVARADDGLLEEDGRVAERRLGLAHAGLERVAQVLAPLDPAHASTAAARDRLGEDREADLLGGSDEGVDVGARLGALEGGQAGLLGGGDGARLVAGQVQHRRRRADEGDAGLGALLGQVGVLGQEAVAGVDRVGTGLDGGPHDPLGVEVGPDRVPLLADPVGLVGLEDVLGLAVLVGEDGDRLGAELGGGTERADGDLTTVRDEDLAEHLTSRGSAPRGGGAGGGTGSVPPILVRVPTRETARPRCGPPSRRYAAPAGLRTSTAGAPAGPHRLRCRVAVAAVGESRPSAPVRWLRWTGVQGPRRRAGAGRPVDVDSEPRQPMAGRHARRPPR